MKTNYTVRSEIKAQSGITLITVMIVLFILTLLGIAATDSSNFQALMVRNNQFRLETFNTSRAEIQDQLVALNGANFIANPANPDVIAVANATTSRTLNFAIDSGGEVTTGDGTNLGSDGTAVFSILFPSQQQVITQNVGFQRSGGCVVNEESLGVNGSLTCHEIQIDSNAQLTGTNIQSQQSQTIQYLAF